jgi:hypothetical protein
MTADTLLEAIGNGHKPTGIYRLVLTVVVALLVVAWGIVGWFIRDELQLMREAQATISLSLAATNTSVANHVSADVDSRSQAAQSRFLLDTRVTKLEAFNQDLSTEILASRRQSEDQVKLVFESLNSIRDSNTS